MKKICKRIFTVALLALMSVCVFVLLSVSFLMGCTGSASSNSAKTDSNSTTEADSALADSSATSNAKKLYQYLLDSYGSSIITGQMENAWNDDCNMLSRVYSTVSKYPALMGFDFMNYTSIGWTANNVQTERAIKFWNGKDYDGNTISHPVISSIEYIERGQNISS